MVCTDLWDKPISKLTEADCPEGLTIAEYNEAQSAGAKTVISSEKPKKRKPREKNALDELKTAIVEELFEYILANDDYSNIVISNPTRTVEFDCGDEHFTINLIRLNKNLAEKKQKEKKQ